MSDRSFCLKQLSWGMYSHHCASLQDILYTDVYISFIIINRKFNHENIVKILAVCVDNDPVFIIMELMPAADLLKFLREARPESVSNHQLCPWLQIICSHHCNNYRVQLC